MLVSIVVHDKLTKTPKLIPRFIVIFLLPKLHLQIFCAMGFSNI